PLGRAARLPDPVAHPAPARAGREEGRRRPRRPRRDRPGVAARPRGDRGRRRRARARDSRGPPAPAGAQPRRSVSAALRFARPLVAAFAVFGLYWGAWAACLPAIQRQTGASEAQLGLGLLCLAVASLPAMFAAGRLADLFGARLVPVALATFGGGIFFPGLAGSVAALYLSLPFVGLVTGAADVAINAQAATIEARHDVRVMDGLHASFSIGVLCGGVGAGLLRRAGGHPSWILGGVACLVLLTALANLAPAAPPEPAQRRVRLDRPLLVVGGVLAIAFLVENGLEGWSALFLERTLGSGPAISGLGPGLFAAAMASGRLLSQRIEGPSVFARMLFAGVAAGGRLPVSAPAQQLLSALSLLRIRCGWPPPSAPKRFCGPAP